MMQSWSQIKTSHPAICYTLMLADDALIMSQRLSAWTGHGPVLEQDIALTNIALDQLGQARNLYDWAAQCVNNEGIVLEPALQPSGATQDTLAYLRTEEAFYNHLLVELPNGHWGQTVAKLFFFAAYQQAIYRQLSTCNHAQLAGIAEKSLKEVNYHLRWSKDWMLRLGDGTPTSMQRLREAIAEVLPYTAELYEVPSYEVDLVYYPLVRQDWEATVAQVLAAIGVDWPKAASFQTGGLRGVHTEHLGYILAEMQYLQRAYPNSTW